MYNEMRSQRKNTQTSSTTKIAVVQPTMEEVKRYSHLSSKQSASAIAVRVWREGVTPTRKNVPERKISTAKGARMI